MSNIPTQIQARVWTRGFSVLFAGLVLGSGLACLAAIFFIRHAVDTPVSFPPERPGPDPFRVAELALLLSQAALALVCLAGTFAAPSRLVRAGLYLQAGAALCLLVSYLAFVANIRLVLPSELALRLPVGASLLNLLGLACLSYGLVPWSRARDSWLLVIQVLLSGAGVVIPWSMSQVHLTELVFEQLAQTACNFLALALLVVRFPFWRRFPLITCLLAARLLVRAYLDLSPNSLGFQFIFLSLSSPEYRAYIEQYSLDMGRSLALNLLFLLGIVVLVQTMRAQKLAQTVLNSPGLQSGGDEE